MGEECPVTCSADSDCEWVAENVGATQACEDGCCGLTSTAFDMEGEAASGAVLVTARLTVALLLYAFVAV